MNTKEFNSLLIDTFDTELSYSSAIIRVNALNIIIYKKESSNSVTLFCPIAKVGQNERKLGLEYIASSNFLGIKTNGACLGFISDLDVIVLKKTFNIKFLSKENLLEKINSFSDTQRSFINDFSSLNPDIDIYDDKNSSSNSYNLIQNYLNLA